MEPQHYLWHPEHGLCPYFGRNSFFRKYNLNLKVSSKFRNVLRGERQSMKRFRLATKADFAQNTIMKLEAMNDRATA